MGKLIIFLGFPQLSDRDGWVLKSCRLKLVLRKYCEVLLGTRTEMSERLLLDLNAYDRKCEDIVEEAFRRVTASTNHGLRRRFWKLRKTLTVMRVVHPTVRKHVAHRSPELLNLRLLKPVLILQKKELQLKKKKAILEAERTYQDMARCSMCLLSW